MGFGSFSGDGLGFGAVFTLENGFSQTASQIERDMKKLESNTDAMEASVNKSMDMLKVGAMTFGAGVALIAPFVQGAKIQAEFEQAEIGLTTLLKSADKAHAVFEQMKKDAAVTPFRTKDLLLANQAIISQGYDADRSRLMVLNLGNALSAMGRGGDDMAAMAINLQQIAANGKATGLDIRQFAMRGINIPQLYADATGKAITSLEGTAYTFDMIELALDHASKTGGKFEGAMERMSKSVAGKISTLRDNIDFAFASLGKAIEPITHKIVDFAIEITTRIQAFAESPFGGMIMKIVFILGSLLTVFGASIIIIAGVRLAITSLTLSMELFGAATLTAMIPWVIFGGILAFIAYKFMSLENRMTKFSLGFKGVLQLFDSFDGKNFSMDETLQKALQQLGIEELVVNIAAMLVKIKLFFLGVWEVAKTVGNIFLWLTDKVVEGLGMIDIKVNAGKEKLVEWVVLGKIVASLIVGYYTMMGLSAIYNFGVMTWTAITSAYTMYAPIIAETLWTLALLVEQWSLMAFKAILNFGRMSASAIYNAAIMYGPLLLETAIASATFIGEILLMTATAVVNFAIMSASAIATGISLAIAFWPVTLVILGIIAVIYALTHLDEIEKWCSKIGAQIGQFVDNMVEKGKSMMLNFLKGMKSVATDILRWVDQFISGIPIIGDIYQGQKMIIGAGADLLQNVYHSFDEYPAQPQPVLNQNSPAIQNAQNRGARNAQGSVNYFAPTIHAPAVDNQPIIIHLDGEPLYNNMQKRQEFNDSRR